MWWPMIFQGRQIQHNAFCVTGLLVLYSYLFFKDAIMYIDCRHLIINLNVNVFFSSILIITMKIKIYDYRYVFRLFFNWLRDRLNTGNIQILYILNMHISIPVFCFVCFFFGSDKIFLLPNLNYIIVNEMTKSLDNNIFKLTLGRCRYIYISRFSNDSLDQFF